MSLDWKLFTITVETSFSAKHQLTMDDGKKEPLHNHDWLVRTAVSAKNLNDIGLAVDFIELKDTIENITAPFNGAVLEEMDCFGTAGKQPSAENVAKYIYNKIEPLLNANIQTQYVEVMEAKGCWAKYST